MSEVQYKPLGPEHQPQPPLPPGYGIVRIEYEDSMGAPVEEWLPVFLEKADREYALLHAGYFRDPYKEGPLHYRSRRKAIGYVWRWHRRYGALGLCLPEHVSPCIVGIVGNLYQHERITVASAAERLGLEAKDVHWIRKHTDLKAVLRKGKERIKGRNWFHCYYVVSLAHLEAYLDVHGYPPHYPGMAALAKERTLPAVVWCV